MLVLMNKVDKLIHVFQDMYVGMQSVSFNRLYVVLDWSLKVHKTWIVSAHVSYVCLWMTGYTTMQIITTTAYLHWSKQNWDLQKSVLRGGLSPMNKHICQTLDKYVS